MLNITKKFRKELFYDRRNYKELVTILLSNGTRLELTNEHLLEGIGFTDMVSEDNNFQIGAAIINSASVKINNMYDDYTDYNFNYAKVYASVGLDFGDGTSEIIRKFTAYVDEAKYNGSAIELSCLDYMGLFDQVYDGQIVFPATTGDIVRYCCTKCNITLNTTTFPRDNITISEAPDFGDNCTYRQLIAWVAQQSCCFARCNAYGELEIKWYDMASLNAEANRLDGGQFDKGTPKYQTGDHADGGGFMTDGDEYDVDQFSATPLPVHVLNGIFSCEVCKDPVTITGISVTSTEYDETTTSGGETTTERRTYTAMVGTTDYVLAISGNPLIASQAMATEVANYIASVLVGFTFWIAHVSHLSDPSIEAGDVMLFSDYKGVTYRGVVSSTTFKCGESQTTDSSAETPVQNTKTQRSGADSVTKAIMDIENWLLREKTAYEQGIDDLSNRLDAKSGLYTTKETTGSGDIWYLHDKPLLADSTKVIKITADAIGFSTDGGTNWNSGMTIDGQFIATKLSAQGVDAGWVRTGILTDKTGNNYWNMTTGEFRLGGGVDASGSGLATSEDLDDFVSDCVVEYIVTTTDTEPSSTASGWSTTATWEKGKYLWSHTKTTYGDGSITRTAAKLVEGPNGTGVSSVETMWIQTTSNSTVPSTSNSGWSTTQPSWVYNRYIWTMSKTTYSDGSVAYTTPVLANALNEDAETVFNKLTNNGQTQGIYRTNGKVYLNAEYMKLGVLASNDSNENFKLDLATGQLTMKKGSVDIGDTNYYFKVNTAGKLAWKSANSKMDVNGNLTCTGADISGTIKTVDGNFETTMDDGWIYFKYNNANVGKIGSALVSGIGNAFNINMMSGANGFGIYDGDGENASALLSYNKSQGWWASSKDIYAKGYKCLTEDDRGITYTFGVMGLDGNVWDLYFTYGFLTDVRQR